VERAQGSPSSMDKAVAEKIEKQIKHQVLISARINMVDYGSLPRSERKSRRVFDQREL
jgi:phenylacetate-CoA ligase